MNNNSIFSRIRKLNHIAGNLFAYWEYTKDNNKFICDQDHVSILNKQGEISSQDEVYSWLNRCPAFQDAFENLISKNKKLDIKVRIEKDGNQDWLRVVGVPSETGTGYYGLIENVTSQVLKDVEFRNISIEMNSFEKGLEQFSIVARTDGRGKITYANEEFCRLSKYTQEELIGQDHRILNSGFHSKEFFKDMWTCIEQGRNWRGVIKNKAKDGSYYWVDTIVIPVISTKGTLIDILSFRFDVTKSQEIQAENLRLRKEIECLKFDLNKEEVAKKV